MEVEETTKQDGMKVIREGLREMVQAQRKKNRLTAINKNRMALGSIASNSSFTPDIVVEKANALKKKALPIEEYRQLQNALIQSEENVNSFLKVGNILFALARDISGNNPALQLCAMSCACNIALGNSKACTSLAKSIGPYLVTDLDTLNYPLLDICVWTVGNLVAGSDKAFEILHAQGCFKYVTSLMQNCYDVILPSVAYTAMHYIRNGFKQIRDDDIIEFTKATAKRNLSFESPYFIWLLALLSSNVSCIPYLYKAVPLIVDYLYQNTTNNFTAVTEITACIRISANTMQEISGQLAMFLLKNPKYTRTDVATLLNRLLSCQHVHIRKETLWLIGNFYNHNATSIRSLIKDIMPQLSSLKQAVLSTTQKTISFKTDLVS